MLITTVKNCIFNVLVPLVIFLTAAIFHPILAAPPTDYWSDFANDDWFNPTDSRYSCSNVGDQDCPYLLKTPADLAGLKDHPTGLEGKYLQLAPDGDTLDLSAHKWVPLNLYGSYDGSAFNESKIVHFDGGNTTITGLYIDTISLTDRTFLTVPKESESPAADLETYPEMQANFNPNESSSQYIKQIPSAGLFSQLYKVHLHRLTITNPQVKIDDNTELKLCQETIEKANKEKQCSQTDYKEKLQDCEDDYGENSGNYDPSQLATCKKIATQNYQECLDDCRKEERKTLENCQAKHGPNGDNDTVAFNNCPTLANEEYASCSDGDPFSGTKHCGRDYKNEVESCENNHGSSGDNDSIALNKCLAKAEQDRDECRNHCLTEKRYALEECQNNPPPLANCSAVADEVYAKCQKIGSCEQLANGLIALNNEGATSLPLSVGVLAGNSRFTRLNDVTVINPDLQINNYYSDAKLVTGGLIGFSSGYTYTINPSVIGGQIITQNENKVKAAVYLGGLIGSNYRSTIINGFASPQITYRNFCNDYYVEADDKYCHDPNEKSYTGSYRIGGLTGESTNNSSINQALCLLNSYSRSNIELNLTDIKTIQELKMPDESGGAIGGISGVLEDAAVNNYYHGNIATNLTFIDNSAQANWETQVKEQGGDGTGALFGFVRGGINPEDYSYPSYLRNYPMRYNHYHVDNSTLPPFGSFSLKESCYQKFQNGDLTENEYQACLTDCNTDYEKDKGDLKENIESKQAECDSLSDPNNLQDCLKELQN
jgi:hypothetical protein